MMKYYDIPTYAKAYLVPSQASMMEITIFFVFIK